MMADDPAEGRAAYFETLRSRLFGIAYRMLGAVEDAEDVVQEGYLRWHRADPATIQTPEGWLVSVVTRLAIDRLRQRIAERERYVGEWLPEPLYADPGPPPDRKSEIASDLSMAFLVLLERLAPEERAAFLLREVFDVDYDEIARVLEKALPATRQLVHRARERVRTERARFEVEPAVSGALLERFLAALAADDREGVLAILDEGATWVSDGGGKVSSATRIVEGADRVASLLLGWERKGKGMVEHRPVLINGEPGFLSVYEGKVFAATSVAVVDGRITAVYRILNPDKLGRVR